MFSCICNARVWGRLYVWWYMSMAFVCMLWEYAAPFYVQASPAESEAFVCK